MAIMQFYQNPIPVDRTLHSTLKFKPQAAGFSFAKNSNSVPVTTAEFGIAGHTYPIVFVTDPQGGGLPLALTGLRQDENLFVDANGQWDIGQDVGYIPGFIRRYPFIPQSDPDQQRYRILIDDKADGYDHPEGIALFNPDGSNSTYLDDMMNLLDQYSISAQHTAEFIKHLISLDLLVPREITSTTPDGKPIQFGGFSVVDEAKLNALSDQELLKMVRNSYLSLIFAHLNSLSNIQGLLARLERRLRNI